MRPLLIGYRTSGELAEQPREVNLSSPYGHTSSVLRKTAGSEKIWSGKYLRQQRVENKDVNSGVGLPVFKL
jgi:hypothetical protein